MDTTTSEFCSNVEVTTLVDLGEFLPVDIAINGAGEILVGCGSEILDGLASFSRRSLTPRGPCVIKIVSGVATKLAGSTRGHKDGNGATAKFTDINGLAVGSDGSIIVADTSCIRKVTPTGVVTTIAGRGIVRTDARGFADG